jgi:hypothetical protein
MASKQEIIQQVVQLLSQLDEGGGDVFDENGMTSGGEVPIWSKLQAGTLGQGGGAIHNKAALQGAGEMRAPLVGNYIDKRDMFGMPQAGQQEEMMAALGIV